MGVKMKYRVVEKSDGTFWPQKKAWGLWQTLTYSSGIGPVQACYYDVAVTIEEAWAKIRAHDSTYYREKARVVKIHEQGGKDG